MKDLQDGYFPYELKFAFPEGVLGDLLDTARGIGFDTSNIRHVPHTI